MITEYDALQLYVGHKEYGGVTPIPEDDMLDFADLGGTYNSQAAAAENTTRLNDFLSQEFAPSIRFGGVPNAQYNDKRQPARAWFSGTIVIPAGKAVLFDGANSRLSWSGLASAITPGITVADHSQSIRCVLRDFDADSDGAGIQLLSPGKGTVLSGIRFAHETNWTTNPCTALSGAVSLDDMTDLDAASYAFKIEDSDGCTIRDCSAMGPGDHGVIVKGRLHDAFLRMRIWGANAGTGFKGQRINGGQLDVICESCWNWGYHLEDCGIAVTDGSGVTHLTHDKPGVADFWVENNHYQDNPKAGGVKVRQGRVRHCGAQFVAGSNAWGSNKIDIDEGSRNSCVLIHDVHVNQSILPMYDLNEEDDQAPTFLLPHETSDALNNNFATAWPSGGEPSVTSTGTQGSVEFLVTFPANCFAAMTGGVTAYWRPWGTLTNFAQQAGDRYIYELELAASLEGYNWCIANDEVNSTLVVPTIAPYSGPAGANWVGLYNAQSRKVLGRVSLQAAGTGKPTPALTWDPGMPDNAQPFTLTVKAWKFYGIRETGGAVPQS